MVCAGCGLFQFSARLRVGGDGYVNSAGGIYFFLRFKFLIES